MIRVTYGKSEMFNPITVLEIDEAADYYRDLATLDAVCLGSPAAGVEVVVRDETGRAVRHGEHGEIHLRSPHMMIGHVDGKASTNWPKASSTRPAISAIATRAGGCSSPGARTT